MKPDYLKIILFFAFLYSIYLVFNQFYFFALAYDESLFINAAIGKDPSTFIDKHWHGIPIMVMDYIGALKSWIYIPIFKIFGVNLLSIRLPMVLVMYFNFYLIYKISLKYFEPAIVYLLLLILFTDYTFIYQHKIDHGPTAIETCLKLLALYFISNKFNLKNNLLILGILLLGVFNKLNFIWFINALFGTFIITEILCSDSTNTSIVQRFLNRKILWASIVYLMVFCFFLLIVKYQRITPKTSSTFSELLESIDYQYNHLIFVVINLRYEYLLGWHSNYPTFFLIGKLIITLTFIINFTWLFFFKKHRQNTHNQLFIITILLVIQFLITKEASNIWHVLMLYPFIQLLILNTFYLVFKSVFQQKIKLILYAFGGIWLVYNLYVYQIFQQKIEAKCNFWLYDSTINKLVEYTQNRPETNIISLGSGIHSQLLVLDKKNKKYQELVAPPNGFEQAYIKQLLVNPSSKLVAENINSNLDLKRHHFYALKNILNANKLILRQLTTINDACGNAQYNIFKIEKALN